MADVHSMKTRTAITADAPAIARLHAESWRVAYRGMLQDDYLDRTIYAERQALWEERFRSAPDKQYVVVAETAGSLTGFACVYGDEDATWGSFLDNLHVAPEQKRQGIGTVLMAEVAAWSLKSWPAAGMYLWVLESNTSGMRFYERLGGTPAGEGVWTPPDGGEYRKLRYAWDRLDGLAVASHPVSG